MAYLAVLRFPETGWHPVTHEPSNVVEQINQTFTCLVTLAGLRELHRLHADVRRYKVRWAETNGLDIEGEGDLIAAESFAATHLGSNRKLSKELVKMETVAAKHRYLFAYAPGLPVGFLRNVGGVVIWGVSLDEFLKAPATENLSVIAS